MVVRLSTEGTMKFLPKKKKNHVLSYTPPQENQIKIQRVMNKQKEAPYQFYKIQAIVWISLISATHTSMGMGPSTGVWETNLWKRTQE